MNKKWQLIIYTASIILIAAGAALVYPPAGLIALGALLWFDLTLDSVQKSRAGATKK